MASPLKFVVHFRIYRHSFFVDLTRWRFKHREKCAEASGWCWGSWRWGREHGDGFPHPVGCHSLFQLPAEHPRAPCLPTLGHNQPRSEVSSGALRCPVLLQHHNPKGSFLQPGNDSAGNGCLLSADTGDVSASPKIISTGRRLNMQIISSLAGLFAGEQWVSQVQDFQIKFILVVENVLLLLSICCLFSDRSRKKNSFAKSRGAAGRVFFK